MDKVQEHIEKVREALQRATPGEWKGKHALTPYISVNAGVVDEVIASVHERRNLTLLANSPTWHQTSLDIIEQQQKELDRYYNANNRLQARCNAQTENIEHQQREVERLKAELKDERFQHNFEKNSHQLTFEGVADKDKEIERLQSEHEAMQSVLQGYAIVGLDGAKNVLSTLSPSKEVSTDVQDDR